MASDSLSVHSPYSEATVCWVVALKSEAKPIISYFKLDHQPGNSIFPIYKNDKLGHSLIISPDGKVLKELKKSEGVVTAKIDPNLSKTLRKKIPSLKSN